MEAFLLWLKDGTWSCFDYFCCKRSPQNLEAQPVGSGAGQSEGGWNSEGGRELKSLGASCREDQKSNSLWKDLSVNICVRSIHSALTVADTEQRQKSTQQPTGRWNATVRFRPQELPPNLVPFLLLPLCPHFWAFNIKIVSEFMDFSVFCSSS